MTHIHVLRRVPSTSTYGKMYEIRLGKDDRIYCTCPAWKYSKGPVKACKHLVGFLRKTLG